MPTAQTRIVPATMFSQLNLLTGLNGENGFSITGSGVGGVNVEISAVANAGDVNGDGLRICSSAFRATPSLLG